MSATDWHAWISRRPASANVSHRHPLRRPLRRPPCLCTRSLPYASSRVVAAVPAMATPTADSDSLSTDDQQYISTFFCKALYDYQSQDDSSLSFRKGDVIEVLTKLETGWWDGLLGDERGWFPSNYVAVISDEEADAVLSAAEDGGPVTQDGRQPHAAYADASTLDNNSETMSSLPSMSSLTSSSSSMPRSLQSDDWADGEVEFEPPRRRAELPGRAPASTPSQPSDFWVPTMSPDGQVSPESSHFAIPGRMCAPSLCLINFLSHDGRRRYST